MTTAQKETPPVIENPEEQLKRINVKIGLAYEMGKADNETIKKYDQRIASYFAIKRRCIQQLEGN